MYLCAVQNRVSILCNTIEEDTQNSYYLNPARQRYPSIPPENSENYAFGGQYIEHSLRSDDHQHFAEQTSSVAAQDFPSNQLDDCVPAANHHFRPRRSLKKTVIIKEEEAEDDTVHLAPVSEEAFDEEMKDDMDEAAPAQVAPTTVAPHELKYSTKEMRDKKMSIFHRREFAYCEVAMTVEEHLQIKDINHVTPQTFSLPDKNGKYQKYKRIRITWAKRDVLNAWRVKNGRKPHELRRGAKYAAARDYWRLQPPHVVKPRKNIEWSKARGPIPPP
ncbi:hypothetical protein EAF04_009354 [Stromatinia cepivora]|nr:hypothetical protein EAF04_009354 [Stromatinia cepivora]